MIYLYSNFGDLKLIYQGCLAQRKQPSNPNQLRVIKELQPIFDHISVDEQSRFRQSIWDKVKSRFSQRNERNGAYIYGDVGTGKTMIMDLFYSACPIKQKLRIHFNEFMLRVHSSIIEMILCFSMYYLEAHELRSTGIHGNQVVSKIAGEYGAQFRLLCLDEFQVVDIADAMILRSVLNELLKERLTLLVTSNRKPGDLYMNGIQRASFMPCIELIEERLSLINLDSGIDFRRQQISNVSSSYFYPISKETFVRMSELFAALTGDLPTEKRQLEVMGRSLLVNTAVKDACWFTYEELFRAPLSAIDYLAICREYRRIFVSGVPCFSDMNMRPEARRFVTFIDIVYDMNRKLVIQTDGPIDDLFQLRRSSKESTVADLEVMDEVDGEGSSAFTGTEEKFAVNRSISRLHQITSKEWWDNIQ